MAHSSPSPDIVTLDNFMEKLPEWSLGQDCYMYAIVDMGSNGIRFSVSDLSPPNGRLLRCIYRERAAISLFDALGPPSEHAAADHPVSPEALEFSAHTINAVVEAVTRFRRIAAQYNVPDSRFSILGTEALRRASNGGTLVAAIQAATRAGVNVLAPEVETLLGAVMGARSSFVDIADGGLFLDMGGGSVQMTWVCAGPPEAAAAAAAALHGVSLPYGAAKLMRVLEAAEASVRDAETETLRRGVGAGFDRLRQRHPVIDRLLSQSQGGGGLDLYLCGGGFRGYGSMLIHNEDIQPYPIPSVSAYRAPGSLFRQTGRMRQVNAEHKGKIYGMSKRRRRQFDAVATVVDALVGILPAIRSATFCPGSNREGALMMMLPASVREGHQPLECLAAAGLSDAHFCSTRALSGVFASAVSAEAFAPLGPHPPDVFSLGLGPLFARAVWERQGEDQDANGSFVLRDAISRDPGVPGLTHLARAVLAVTLCWRWGGRPAPHDAGLYAGLVAIMERADERAEFYARYIGAVAAITAAVVPVFPEYAHEWSNLPDVMKPIRFRATAISKPKAGIDLEIIIPEVLVTGVDVESLYGAVEKAGKTFRGSKIVIKTRVRYF